MGQLHQIGAKEAMTIANNIAAFREAKGWARPELAKRMKTTPQQIERLEKGQRGLTTDWIEKAALALDVSVGDIITPGARQNDSEPDDVDSSRQAQNADLDEVEIQQWDIAYGMGGGSFLDLPVTGDRHKFSRSWLRQFTHAPPQQIFLASGTGDSMTPTILDADIVVIDTSQREVRMADRIYAAAYGQTGIIKRLRPMPDGSVKILSDNPNVSPETAYDGELSIVGRVVAIVRKT